MRKSALVTLIIAIVLIVLGIGLSVYGVYLDSPHSYYHAYNHGFVSYHVRYFTSALPGSGHAAATFGHMLFNGGLVTLVISFILNMRKDKEDKETKIREEKADKAEAVKARNEAIDAKVDENPSSAEQPGND